MRVRQDRRGESDAVLLDVVAGVLLALEPTCHPSPARPGVPRRGVPWRFPRIVALRAVPRPFALRASASSTRYFWA